MNYSKKHLSEAIDIIEKIDSKKIENIVEIIKQIKNKKGRIFFLGVGGSAANCSHAVNDFRKIVGIESYAPTDNVSELTARTNDEGWETVFSGWLKISRISKNDAVFVFSVGGGNVEKNVSVNLVKGLQEAKNIGATILGVVGRDGGFTNEVGDCVVVIPTVDESHTTPHTEAFHAVVWHCLVSHPKLQIQSTKW